MKVTGPGMGPAGVDSGGLVDRILEADRVPVEQQKVRRDRVVTEKNEYSSFAGLLDGLASAAQGMRLEHGFNRLKVNSSHPDILEGVADKLAAPGSWEFEVNGLAQSDRHLDAGFPDLDQTPVGFGWMALESADGALQEVEIAPGSTLREVADQINASATGMKAMIVNTGIGEDPFRLMVSSEATGAAARIVIDPDTTFLDFDNIKAARNLAVKFEDVEVERPDNRLHDLINGVKLDVKKAEPGTKVSVQVAHDVDATFDAIAKLTEGYNSINGYFNSQYQIDPGTGKAGTLAADGGLRSMLRELKSSIAQGRPAASEPGKGPQFGSLAEVGITTNAKTGDLMVDGDKLKAALAANYAGVAALFVEGPGGKGLAARLGDAIARFKDPEHGVLKSRMNGLDRRLRDENQRLERAAERAAERETAVRQRMAALDNRLSQLQGQSDFIAARLGPSAGGGSTGESGGVGG